MLAIANVSVSGRFQMHQNNERPPTSGTDGPSELASGRTSMPEASHAFNRSRPAGQNEEVQI